MPPPRAGRRLARADGSGRVGNGSTVRRNPAYAAPEGRPKAGPSRRQRTRRQRKHRETQTGVCRPRGPAEGWPEQTAGGLRGAEPSGLGGPGGYPPRASTAPLDAPPNWTKPMVRVTMGCMSASDAAPLPRLGQVFFDVRGSSRSMRVSWYGDTGVAVFSIWQGGRCTGTFRLPVDDLARMVDTLRGGPDGELASPDGPDATRGYQPDTREPNYRDEPGYHDEP